LDFLELFSWSHDEIVVFLSLDFLGTLFMAPQ
jgi:hypothetical protein